MSNSILFLIVVIEAVIIIWLASKLTQYRKIDQILGASGAKSLPAGDQPENQHAVSAQQLSQSTPALVSPSDAEAENEGEPQENIEEAKHLQWVMARCRYAEFYLEQLDDDYERGQFRHIVDGCVAKARKISDSFFRDSALHSIILLLDRAGWEQYRDSLLAEVGDEIVRQRIEIELQAEEA
ncbi:MAG: hypothetical protein AB8B84_01365 [Granulosicoccus sp.]